MYYDETAQEVLKELKTAETGIAATEAKSRLNVYGKNVLIGARKISPLKVT